ncbi:MAG: hypothetical protein H7Z17_05180 [Fuerstia sp.]|nr:hypothetical protein [Fuerstiella sp.]
MVLFKANIRIDMAANEDVCFTQRMPNRLPASKKYDARHDLLARNIVD